MVAARERFRAEFAAVPLDTLVSLDESGATFWAHTPRDSW